jgi:hypothetical protein
MHIFLSYLDKTSASLLHLLYIFETPLSRRYYLSNILFWVLKWNYQTLFIVKKEGVKLFIKEGGT